MLLSSFSHGSLLTLDLNDRSSNRKRLCCRGPFSLQPFLVSLVLIFVSFSNDTVLVHVVALHVTQSSTSPSQFLPVYQFLNSTKSWLQRILDLRTPIMEYHSLQMETVLVGYNLPTLMQTDGKSTQYLVNITSVVLTCTGQRCKSGIFTRKKKYIKLRSFFFFIVCPQKGTGCIVSKLSIL